MRPDLKKRIKVNGNFQETMSDTLSGLVIELDYADTIIATAKNQEFVRYADRDSTKIADGDEIEILVPMQGG